jgi:hypothetical protein
MPKIAEMKLLSCGLEVADIRKNCNCGIAVAEDRHQSIKQKIIQSPITSMKRSAMGAEPDSLTLK